jgi:hypothetical protein
MTARRTILRWWCDRRGSRARCVARTRRRLDAVADPHRGRPGGVSGRALRASAGVLRRSRCGRSGGSVRSLLPRRHARPVG